MRTIRAALAVALVALLFLLAVLSLAAFGAASYFLAKSVSLVSSNEALQLLILVAGGLAAFAAALTLIRFFLALFTPRLVLPRCIPLDRLDEAEQLGLAPKTIALIQHVVGPEAVFDLVAVTSQPRIGTVVAWGTRILVVNPFLVTIFSEDELTAVLLHECGHVRVGLPAAYVIARQVNAARSLISSEIDPASKNSVFNKAIDIVSWVVPVPPLHGLIRSCLTLAALPLLGITVGMCHIIVEVFRSEFHAAEFAADSFVRDMGYTGGLTRALLRLCALDHLVRPRSLGRLTPEMPAPLPQSLWPTSPMQLLPEPAYVEIDDLDAEMTTSPSEVMMDALNRASTTHPPIASRIRRLGEEAVLALGVTSALDLLEAVEGRFNGWDSRFSTADNLGSMTLGFVSPLSSAMLNEARDRLDAHMPRT